MGNLNLRVLLVVSLGLGSGCELLDGHVEEAPVADTSQEVSNSYFTENDGGDAPFVPGWVTEFSHYTCSTQGNATYVDTCASPTMLYEYSAPAGAGTCRGPGTVSSRLVDCPALCDGAGVPTGTAAADRCIGGVCACDNIKTGSNPLSTLTHFESLRNARSPDGVVGYSPTAAQNQCTGPGGYFGPFSPNVCVGGNRLAAYPDAMCQNSLPTPQIVDCNSEINGCVENPLTVPGTCGVGPWTVNGSTINAGYCKPSGGTPNYRIEVTVGALNHQCIPFTLTLKDQNGAPLVAAIDIFGDLSAAFTPNNMVHAPYIYDSPDCQGSLQGNTGRTLFAAGQSTRQFSLGFNDCANANAVTITAKPTVVQCPAIAFTLLQASAGVGSAPTDACPTITMMVNPPTATLGVSQSQRFTAAAFENGQPTAASFYWSMDQNGVGQIDNQGNYTAPASLANDVTFQIFATHDYWTSIRAAATVTVRAPRVTSIMVTPMTVTLSPNGTQSFAAMVMPSDLPPAMRNVSWSLISGPGTLTSTGTYTAPSMVTTAQTATVKATSTLDNTKFATAIITLSPLVPISIMVAPMTVSLSPGQQQQFSAMVMPQGLPPTMAGVTWSLGAGGVGTLSASGLYTAPASITTSQTFNIIATSTYDLNVRGTASVTLVAPSVTSVMVTPMNLSPVMVGSTPTQFSAMVMGSGPFNPAVTWSISPLTGAGSIDSAGRYTPPSSIAPPAGATSVSAIIRATSQADATKYGTAIVTIVRPSVTSVMLMPMMATVRVAGPPIQFIPMVMGNGPINAAVTWSFTGPGSLSSGGLYSPPTQPLSPSPQTATVRATSVADPSKYSTAFVTVTNL